jgi:hypothetical protein
MVSQSGVYGYAGDYGLTPVGDPIYNYMLGPFGNLDPTNDEHLFFFYVQQLDEVWLFYPSTGNAYCDTLLRFSLKYKNWFVRKFLSTMSGAATIFNTSSQEWIQIVGTWQQRAGNVWNQRASAGNFPLVLLCAYVDRVTYLYDYTSQTDAGSVITWYAITKDYPILDQKLILDGINVYAKGTALFEVSIDSGLTYQTIGTLAFGQALSRQNLDFELTGNFFRFRISGTDPLFQLSDISYRYMTGSEY